jgi:lipopolysaccharide transport system permease protein
VFNLFSELAYRAPSLLHEHAGVIKKSIFPSETLAWTAAIRAAVYAGISLAVLVIFELLAAWRLPLMAVLLPFVVAPLFLFLLGITWFLMALGSFTRDVAHLMISIVPVLMFTTPIFYAIDDVPPDLRLYLHLNPIGNYVEMIRDLLLLGRLPGLLLYCGTVLGSIFVFFFSYRFFMQYKAVFTDVI